jgi:hypothetical protein
MFQKRNDQCLSFTSGTTTQSVNIDCTQIDRISLQAAYTAVTQSAAVFASASAVNDTTSVFTKTAHGLVTGVVGQFTTSSALPTGLATTTNYWVIVVDANDVQFASTLANALAGTFVAITSNGTGNQTFTPTSLSGVLKVSTSNDCVSPANWTDIPGTTVTITTTGNTNWSSLTTYIASSVTNPQLDPSAKWLRVLFTPTSGAVSLTVTANASSLTQN